MHKLKKVVAFTIIILFWAGGNFLMAQEEIIAPEKISSSLEMIKFSPWVSFFLNINSNKVVYINSSLFEETGHVGAPVDSMLGRIILCHDTGGSSLVSVCTVEFYFKGHNVGYALVNDPKTLPVIQVLPYSDDYESDMLLSKIKAMREEVEKIRSKIAVLEAGQRERRMELKQLSKKIREE